MATAMANAQFSKATQPWTDIPAIIIYDQSDYGTWGRNLSENKLRSFDWIAECICFAKMRTEGKDKKEIGRIFGIKGEKSIEQRISLGNLPTLLHLRGQNIEGETGFALTFKDAVQFLLPLRIEVGREESGAPSWDYTEVNTCIDKLIFDEVSADELPTYSADRRVAIKEAQQRPQRSKITDADVWNRIRRKKERLRDRSQCTWTTNVLHLIL